MASIAPFVPRALGRLALLLAGVLPLTAGAQVSMIPVGVPSQVDFAVTGVPKNAAAYALWGLPPGLTVVGAGQSGDTYALTGPFGTISGTPTTVGSYTLNIMAWESPDHTGVSRTYTYTLVVSDGTTALPPEPALTIQPAPAPVVSTPAPVVTSGSGGGSSGGGGGGGGAPSLWFSGLLVVMLAARCRPDRCSRGR